MQMKNVVSNCIKSFLSAHGWTKSAFACMSVQPMNAQLQFLVQFLVSAEGIFRPFCWPTKPSFAHSFFFIFICVDDRWRKRRIFLSKSVTTLPNPSNLIAGKKSFVSFTTHTDLFSFDFYFRSIQSKCCKCIFTHQSKYRFCVASLRHTSLLPTVQLNAK